MLRQIIFIELREKDGIFSAQIQNGSLSRYPELIRRGPGLAIIASLLVKVFTTDSGT